MPAEPRGNRLVDLVLQFAGAGLWSRFNDTQFIQLHSFDTAALATGDLVGHGQVEVLADFPGSASGSGPAETVRSAAPPGPCCTPSARPAWSREISTGTGRLMSSSTLGPAVSGRG